MNFSTMNKSINARQARLNRMSAKAKRNTQKRKQKMQSYRQASHAPVRPFQRKIRFPHKNTIKRPEGLLHLNHSGLIQSGLLQNTFYTDVTRFFRFFSGLRAITFHYTFMVIVLLFIIGVSYAAAMIDGSSDMVFMPINMVMSFVIWAGIAALFVRRRIKDNNEFFNFVATHDKSELNRKTLELYHTEPDLSASRELPIIEHVRTKHNKTILFPTSVERYATTQMQIRKDLFQHRYYYDFIIEHEETFNHEQLVAEHSAAKQIADLKVEMFGGENEYDDMVKKYRSRMDPSARVALNL